MKDAYKILICIGASIAVGFAICWFAIVQPAGARADAALTKSNALVEQYRKQAADGLITIGDLQTTLKGAQSDIGGLRVQITGLRGVNSRLDATNKQLEIDKGRLADEAGQLRDYYNKSQQQDKQFGDAVDNAAAAVLSALTDVQSLQGH